MIVTGIRDEVRSDGLRELSGKLRFAAEPGIVHPIWLAREDFGPGPEGFADPLFANLLIIAMAMGETLRIEGPVTGALVEKVQKDLVPVLRRWHPRLHEIELEADLVSIAPAPASTATGALFSAGVDSWYTLLRARSEIDALVHIHGFEIRPDDEKGWSMVHRAVSEVGADQNLRVIPVLTNFMDASLHNAKRLLEATSTPWLTLGNNAWYGSMLVAVALSLRPALGRLVIPASWSEKTQYPIASHPLMEPAWSTEIQRYEIQGFDASRIDKVRWLVEEHPEVMPRLRVCIQNSEKTDGALNCGRCVKCLRTMMEIRVCGGRETDASFARPLDLPRAMRRRYPGDTSIWLSLGDAAEAAGDEEIVDAVRVITGQRLHLPRILFDLKSAIRHRIRKAGGG